MGEERSGCSMKPPGRRSILPMGDTEIDAYRQKGRFLKIVHPIPLFWERIKQMLMSLRYNLAKKKYKGLIREEVLAFFFHYIRGVLYNVGFEPQVETMLADYYSQPKISQV